MSAYYPTQGSAYAGQPVVYPTSGYNGYQPQYATTGGAFLGQPPVVVVPSQGSHHSHHSHHNSRHSHSGSRHGHGHHHHSSHVPTVIAPGVAPVIMQPSYGGGYGHYHLSFGERLRRFFGLAPRGPFKYRNNKGTWGFMGYSRRQRYSDARTGAEVDRKGRPIYRV